MRRAFFVFSLAALVPAAVVAAPDPGAAQAQSNIAVYQVDGMT